ncbi:MAG: membrane protein insertase YidC, partial [Longimicrobiales bacterium]
MEERRLLLAVALSLLILAGYQMLFGPTGPPPSTETPAASPSSTPGPPAAQGSSDGDEPAAVVAGEPEAEAEPAPKVAAEREKRVEVLGEDFTIAFSNRGARLLSWTLARYRTADGRPEEMVPALTPGLKPLDLETDDAQVNERLKQALFEPSSETLRVMGTSPRTLTFRYADGLVEATKALTFQGGGLVSVSVSVRSGGQSVPTRLLWGPGLG